MQVVKTRDVCNPVTSFDARKAGFDAMKAGRR